MTTFLKGIPLEACLSKEKIKYWAETDPDVAIELTEKTINQPLLDYQKAFIRSLHEKCKNIMCKNTN